MFLEKSVFIYKYIRSSLELHVVQNLLDVYVKSYATNEARLEIIK